jgi:hypothetical protein
MSCTTTAVAGYSGTVTGVAGGSEIKEWSASIVQEVLDATSFASSGWKQVVGGIKSATGTLSAVGAPFTNGANASAVFATGGGTSVSCSILVNNVVITTPVDGLVTYTADWASCGEVTVS